MGGANTMLLGNLIHYYFGVGRNWPMAPRFPWSLLR